MAYIQLLPFKLNSISEGQCLIVFLICILVQAKARTATGMQVDVMEDGVADTDLFALSAIKAKKDLVRIEDAGAIEDVEDTYSSSDEMLNGGHRRQDHSDDDSEIDPDEERQRYSHVPPLCSCNVLDVTGSILSG
jgi:hypothetical protein